MRKKTLLLFISVLLWAVLNLSCLADEGMWLLDRVDRLPIDSLKVSGLELDAEEIYNPKGGGIADAVVKVGGGTGSFVSGEGLIITNHHVAFTGVQRQSTPEHNYIKEGFFAENREKELPAIGYHVYVVQSFEDMTQKILSAMDEKMSDLERYKAIEKISKKIIRDAEKEKDVKCKLASMYGGSQYYLFTYFVIRDVRLVYVPPGSIGDYGGEIDNWMWPRHAGDFAFLRAYVAADGKSADYSKENIPYNSKVYLRISSSGVREDDFVMLIGFPGTTRRYESSFSIDQMVNCDYPEDIQTRQEEISILEKVSKEDSSVAIRLSSHIKGLNNYLKKHQGMLEGFKRAEILQRKIEEERLLTQFLNENPRLKEKYGQILPQLDSVFNERKRYRDKELALKWMTDQCDFLNFASTIYKWSLEKEKDDPDRELGYQDRDTLETREKLEDAQVNLVPSADREVFIYFLKKALELPSGQKIVAVEKILQGKENHDPNVIVEKYANDLFQKTRLGSAGERLKMLGMSKEELEKLNDPFIDFAKELEAEREELREKDKEFSGALTRLVPELIQAHAEQAKRSLYPDANGTIRFNYGQVKGYVPRDAVRYNYVTTLTGVMEKDADGDPFDVPEELEEIYSKGDFGSYLDASIRDIPVNFLSTHDITNGNSGSPVMNGRGELVGLAFDGNYESISADYLFEPEITRAINVDIRYVLFLMDKVYHVRSLLKELSIQ